MKKNRSLDKILIRNSVERQQSPQQIKLVFLYERSFPYHFSSANQWKAKFKIFSWTRCAISKDRRDWHILARNDKRFVLHNLNRTYPEATMKSAVSHSALWAAIKGLKSFSKFMQMEQTVKLWENTIEYSKGSSGEKLRHSCKLPIHNTQCTGVSVSPY